jgi:hypothetical protein
MNFSGNSLDISNIYYFVFLKDFDSDFFASGYVGGKLYLSECAFAQCLL